MRVALLCQEFVTGVRSAIRVRRLAAEHATDHSGNLKSFFIDCLHAEAILIAQSALSGWQRPTDVGLHAAQQDCDLPS